MKLARSAQKAAVSAFSGMNSSPFVHAGLPHVEMK